jgi:hypothetical protein
MNNKEIKAIIKTKPQIVLNTECTIQLVCLKGKIVKIENDYKSSIKYRLNKIIKETPELVLSIYSIDVNINNNNLTMTAVFNEPITQELYKILFTEILQIKNEDYLSDDVIPNQPTTLLFYKDNGKINNTYIFADEDWEKVNNYRTEQKQIRKEQIRKNRAKEAEQQSNRPI